MARPPRLASPLAELARRPGSGLAWRAGEINELLSNNPEIIIIGTGQNGALVVDEKTTKQLKTISSELIIAETPKAIEIYNTQVKSGKRVNALMHTTC